MQSRLLSPDGSFRKKRTRIQHRGSGCYSDCEAEHWGMQSGSLTKGKKKLWRKGGMGGNRFKFLFPEPFILASELKSGL
jgi:hypothetical protein